MGWFTPRNQTKWRGPGGGAQGVEAPPPISCAEMLPLIENCYTDNWGARPELRGAAWHHLEACRHCYSKLVDLELGFEAVLMAETEGETSPETDEVEADIVTEMCPFA